MVRRFPHIPDRGKIRVQRLTMQRDCNEEVAGITNRQSQHQVNRPAAKSLNICQFHLLVTRDVNTSTSWDVSPDCNEEVAGIAAQVNRPANTNTDSDPSNPDLGLQVSDTILTTT